MDNRDTERKEEKEVGEKDPAPIPLKPILHNKETDENKDDKRETKDHADKSERQSEIQDEHGDKHEDKQRSGTAKENETRNLEEGRLQEKEKDLENGTVPTGRIRRTGAIAPHPLATQLSPRHRKISFADDVEQKLLSEGEPQSEELPPTDLTKQVIPEALNEDDPTSTPRDHLRTPVQTATEDDKDRTPFLTKREARYSTTSRASRFSMASRPSFSGLTTRPSMASLKSAITRVNSELYPERGSFVANGLGQSFAELPEAIAAKLYIVTQVLAAVSVSMGSMAVGFTAAYTSPALASMNEPNSTMNLTADQRSWVGSLMPLSALTGSIMGGYLVDALGRKMLIMACGPPFFAAMIIIGSAVNVWMLYVGRVISGLCVGLLTLSLPVYLGETIQPEIRGTLGLLPTTIGNTGILFCFLVGSFVNWSWLAYIGAGIPALFFCLMIFVPETPRWYISKGQDDNAERSLQWLRGSDNDVEFELEAIQKNFEASASEKSGLKDLFQKRYLKPLSISIGLMLVQQLSGINAVIFYTVEIFELAGSKLDGNLSTIIVGVVNFLSTFLANILIDKLGRKILLYISDVAMIVSLFALGSFFYIQNLSDLTDETNKWNSILDAISWLPLLSFMVYVIAFSLGWGPIPWLFMGEALPAKIRGPAASLVTSLNWGCTFIVTKTFQGLIDAMGASNVFYMFGVVMVIGLFFAIFFVPETKGKSLEEIEIELSGSSKTERMRRYSEISGIIINPSSNKK